MNEYALTEKEREWLEKRKIRCSYCIHYKGGIEGVCFWCPDKKKFETSAYSLEPNYRDAAEFESKAKVILARYNADDSCVPGGLMYCDSPDLTCFDCRIANANILAEQEMRGLCPKN